jgi:hypothetical protein
MPVTVIALALPGAAAHASADSVTNAELAIISTVAALAGVALGIAGNAWLDRLKERRAARRELGQAMIEMLAATDDLMSGIRVVRAIYDRSDWRQRARFLAGVLAATGIEFGDESFTPNMLRDARKASSWLERIVTLVWRQDEQQRTSALSLTTLLLPRTNRFYAAAAALTLGLDKQIAGAVEELTPAVTGFLEAVTAKDREYNIASNRAEISLGKFREIADQRRK